MHVKVRYNDIGVVFRVTVKDENDTVQDLSTATVKQILLKAPDRTVLTKTASFTTDGTDGKIQYQTVDGDLTQVGTWKLQAYIDVTSGAWHTTTSHFSVEANLD